MRLRLLPALTLAIIIPAAGPLDAQVASARIAHQRRIEVHLSGALQRDAQRFRDDVVPTRLSGEATGWTASLAVRMWRHLSVTVEWSDAGAITDSRTIVLDVNGRTASITSSFTHGTRAIAVLAGAGHPLWSRGWITYSAGVSTTTVGREFTSDASGLVLVAPSDRASSSRSIVEDRFRTPAGGVDAEVRLRGRLHLVTGVRMQAIRLRPDVDGWSLRTFAGAGWAF